MKTLDEVIAEMERMEFIGTLADALNYLKESRDKRDRILDLEKRMGKYDKILSAIEDFINEDAR